MAPAVANGTVYVGSGDRSFYAIDAATGKKKWSYEAGGGMVPDNDRGYPFPAALLTGRGVYFVTDAGLHAVDAQTGERKWFLKNLVEPWHGPVLGNGVIFVTTGAVLHAVDWESGEAKWVARVDGSNITSITAPVTARGLVFFATINGSTRQATLYAVDAADGQVKWSAAPQPVFETPIIVTAGEAVYLATDTRVVALTMEAGRDLWSFRADSIDPGVWADDRHLYVPTHKGSLERPRDTLHALALSTGQEKWSKDVRGSVGVSLIHDGVVYAGREPVFAFDAATGRQLWSTKGLGSPQLIYSGKLFSISETVSRFGTDSVDQGYLSAVDAKTGKLAPSK